jgi:rsbT co-antagonist protein RsbR
MADARSILHSKLLQLSDQDIERRRKFVGLEPADLARIAAVKEPLTKKVDEHASVFFSFLSKFEEAAPLFQRQDLLTEAKRLKREHLIAMVQGEYGRPYVEQRLELGLLYGRVGLDVRVFLGAFHQLMKAIGTEVMRRADGDPLAAFENFMALKKIGFFDIGLIVDVMIAERERTISLQQEAIRELSTPVLQIRDRLLILPIIGMIDSNRAKQLTDNLLRAIRDNRAKVVVMDITGVAAVDSKVANHLIQTVAAARLMGAVVIVTGLSADVAQALVALGVDLRAINTVGDLQGGLELADRLLANKIDPSTSLSRM